MLVTLKHISLYHIIIQEAQEWSFRIAFEPEIYANTYLKCRMSFVNDASVKGEKYKICYGRRTTVSTNITATILYIKPFKWPFKLWLCVQTVFSIQ